MKASGPHYSPQAQASLLSVSLGDPLSLAAGAQEGVSPPLAPSAERPLLVTVPLLPADGPQSSQGLTCVGGKVFL